MADSTPGAVATPEEEGYWAPAAQASTPAATEPAKPIAQSPEHEDYWAPASRATPAPSDESYWTTPAQDNTPAPTPVVAPPGNTIQAAPPPTQLEQLRNTIANSAIGTALENAAPKVADLLHLHPTETVNSPTYQQDQQQLIAPQYAAEGAGKQGPNGEPSKFSDVAKGVGEAVGGLTSAPMLAAAAIPVGELAGLFGATGAKLIPRLVSAGFATTMLKGLYDKVGPFRDAIHRGDYATARQLAGQAIVEAPLAAATALHAARGSHVAQPSSGEPAIPTAQPTPEPQPLAKEPVTGREVLQPNATPAKLNKAAKQEAPALKAGLETAVSPIRGARVDAVRESKNPERIKQKIEEEGQPASTIPDYLASRVVVDSPEAHEAAVKAIKAQFPTVRDVDQFNDGDEDFGYRVHKLQVNTPSGLTAEVHIVPKEVADINADEHMNYKKARQADITGSDKQFDAAAKKAKDANDAAMEKFNARNAQEKPKYSHGSSQVNIEDESEAGKALNVSRGSIPDGDLAGKGKDVGGNHVTVRYGLQGELTPKLREYIEGLKPFEAKVGTMDAFPPSESSDGAAPIHAKIESPQLEKINSEIGNHAEFKKSDFDDYKPHATIAYVKPEVAQKYVGRADASGRKFPVKSIAISDREGNHTEIELKGKGGREESPEPEKPAVSQPATPATPKAGSYALLPDGSVGKVDYYNEGMNRGRMTTVDGRKLPTVRGADMTPLAEVKPGKEATGEPLEKELAERNKTEGPKLLAQYLKDNVYHGIPSVSTDAAKSLYPEYVADPTKTNSDVNQAAAAIADAAWRTLISRPPVEGKEIVSVLTGAPASGKTTMVRDGGAGNSIGINREAILQDLPYASKLVDDVINSGRVPEISLAYTRDPAENLRRAVARATESGRPVPIDYMAKAYVTVPKIISALAEKYGDKIKVDAWDTTENKPVTHKGTVQPAVEATGKYTEQTAREAMLDELRHLRTQGKVSEKLYEAFTAPSLSEQAAGHPGQVDTEAGSGARGERKDADRGADAGSGRQEGVRLNASDETGVSGGDRQNGGKNVDADDEGRDKEKPRVLGNDAVASTRNETPSATSAKIEEQEGKVDAKTGVPEEETKAPPASAGQGERSVGSDTRRDDGSGDRLLLRGSGSSGQGEGASGQVAEGKKGGVDVLANRGNIDRGSEAPVSDEGRSTSAGDREGNKEGRTEPTGLQPGEVGRAPLSELHVDPKRFQYKLNTDESGATNKLKDARAALAEVIRGTAGEAREESQKGPATPKSGEASKPARDRELTKSKQLAAALTKAGKKVKTADEIKPGVAFKQGDETGPTWYLKSERLIDQKMKGPMSGPDVLRMLENGGVKRDELKWTGLEDALKGKFRVKPEEVKQAIAEGGIQIKEVTKGGQALPGRDYDPDPDGLLWPPVEFSGEGEDIADGGPTKYSSYQLPGGENYREMLLTMPERQSPAKRALEAYRDTLREKYGFPIITDEAAKRLTPEERAQEQKLFEAVDHTQDVPRGFKSGHWDEPNILAHIRFNDRVTPEGKKLLHIEEIQSDWHQKGRDKGYKPTVEEHRALLRAANEAARPAKDALRKVGDLGFDSTTAAFSSVLHNDDWAERWDAVPSGPEDKRPGMLTPEEAKSVDDWRAAELKVKASTAAQVPDAPFKKDWHEMAFRRAVRYAAENDYDGVSWTPGEKQNERYQLSNQVDSVSFQKEGEDRYQLYASPKDQEGEINLGVKSAAELADTVGKELARKIVEHPGQKHTFEGIDLKIGGEGMKGFYDKIIPDYARKFGKQWGAKVGEENIGDGEDDYKVSHVPRSDPYSTSENHYRLESKGSSDALGWYPTAQAAWDAADELSTMKVPTLDITPAMRKSVVEEGVPMFKGKTPKELMQSATRVALAARGDVIPGDETYGHAPMMEVNAFAREALNAIDPTLNEGGKWDGVTLPKGYADATIQGLNSAAADMRGKGNEPHAQSMEKLAEQMESSRDEDGNVILLHDASALGAIGEEQFHGYQLRKGAGLGDIAMQMGQNPEIRKAQRYLQKKGYADDPTVAVLEATAKAANGDWAGAGLTREEGAQVLTDFFDSLVKARGEEVLDNVPVLAEEMQHTLDQARAKYDRQTAVSESEKGINAAEARAPEATKKTWQETVAARRGIPDRKNAAGAEAERFGSATQSSLFKAGKPVEEKDEDALDRLTSKTKALDTKKQTLAEKLGKSANKSVTAVTENVSKAAELKDNILRNGKAMLQNLVKPREWTDYDSLTGEFQAQEQKADLAMAEYAKEIKRVVPDKIRREAITNWIQANGDKDLLKERARTSQSKYRAGYKLAAELTPDEVAIAKGMRQYMNEQFDAGLKAGLDVHFANLYMSQIYEGDAQGLKSLINFGELAPNPAFIKKRVFQNYFEAETAGETPKDKDAAFLLTAYHDSFTKAVSSRAYIRSLLEGKATDGRPLAILDTNGAYVQISPDQERYVITPKPRPDDMAKYRHIDHPALRNWKWDLSDKEAEEVNPKLFEDATKALVKQGDLMLHPEIATRVRNILSKSAIGENAIGRAALAVSSSLKHTLLSFSGFHQTQETIHALGHKVNPLNMVKLDLRDTKQYDLASHGLLVADFSGQQAFSEGVSGGALVNYIPVIGDTMAAYQHHLFRDYIPRLKMTMALHALERNTVRYAGKLDRDQILRLTADQSNAAFGGQNQKMMGDLGTNKTFQDITRLLLLAPDFLWSRMKFAGQALLPYGMEQRAALVRSALVMYAGARILNYILNDGDAKFDKKDAFTVVYKGKGYGVRSVPEDILHLIEDPRSFVYNRINPMTTKPAIEFITGRDAFGRQKAVTSQAEDFVKGIAPIPAQGYINNNETSALQSILGAMGIQVTQYRTTAEQDAHQARMRMIPDTPEDKEEEAESRLKLKMEKDLRAGKITTTDIWNKVKAGKLTPHEAGRAVKDAQLTPLQKDFKALTMKDAMDVYAKATPAERLTLKPELEAKRMRTQKEKPRVMAMLNGKLDKLLAQ